LPVLSLHSVFFILYQQKLFTPKN